MLDNLVGGACELPPFCDADNDPDPSQADSLRIFQPAPPPDASHPSHCCRTSMRPAHRMPPPALLVARQPWAFGSDRSRANGFRMHQPVKSLTPSRHSRMSNTAQVQVAGAAHVLAEPSTAAPRPATPKAGAGSSDVEGHLAWALAESARSRRESQHSVAECEVKLRELFPVAEQKVRAKSVLHRASKSIGRQSGAMSTLEDAARALHAAYLDAQKELHFCRAGLSGELDDLQRSLVSIQTELKGAHRVRKAERERLEEDHRLCLEAMQLEHSDVLARQRTAAATSEAVLRQELKALGAHAEAREVELLARGEALSTRLAEQAAETNSMTSLLSSDLVAATERNQQLEDKLQITREKLVAAVTGDH